MLSQFIVTVALHAEKVEHVESVNHWIVGGIAMSILTGLMVGLLAFAGGREHA